MKVLPLTIDARKIQADVDALHGLPSDGRTVQHLGTGPHASTAECAARTLYEPIEHPETKELVYPVDAYLEAEVLPKLVASGKLAAKDATTVDLDETWTRTARLVVDAEVEAVVGGRIK